MHHRLESLFNKKGYTSFELFSIIMNKFFWNAWFHIKNMSENVILKQYSSLEEVEIDYVWINLEHKWSLFELPFDNILNMNLIHTLKAPKLALKADVVMHYQFIIIFHKCCGRNIESREEVLLAICCSQKAFTASIIIMHLCHVKSIYPDCK